MVCLIRQEVKHVGLPGRNLVFQSAAARFSGVMATVSFDISTAVTLAARLWQHLGKGTSMSEAIQHMMTVAILATASRLYFSGRGKILLSSVFYVHVI